MAWRRWRGVMAAQQYGGWRWRRGEIEIRSYENSYRINVSIWRNI
jgi:hypothetical protein